MVPKQSSQSAINRAVYVVAAVSALGLIWGGRFVPFQDYADWIYEARLFTRMLQGELPPEFVWTHSLPPNALMSLVVGTLGLVVSVELAGKLFLSAYVALFLWAGRRLLATRGVTGPLALLPAAFVLNYSVLHGNINSALGLALFLAGAAYLIRNDDAARPRTLAVFSLLLYLAHGAALFAWLVLLATFAGVRRDRARWRTAALALLPVLPLGLVYAAARRSLGPWVRYADGPSFGWLSFLSLKGSTFTSMLALVHGFDPLYTRIAPFVPLLVAVNFAFIALLLVLMRSALRGGVSGKPWWWAAGVILFVVCLVAPRHLAGLVNPGERLVLPALFLIALEARPPARPGRWELAFAVALFVCQAVVFMHAREAQAAVSAFASALERESCGRSLGVVPASHFDFGAARPARKIPPGWLLLPRHYPLLWQPINIERERDQAAPIFDTGLYQYRGPRTRFDSWALLDKGALPEVLAVAGSVEARTPIAVHLQGHYRERAQGEGFTLLEAEGLEPARAFPDGNFSAVSCSIGRQARSSER